MNQELIPLRDKLQGSLWIPLAKNIENRVSMSLRKSIHGLITDGIDESVWYPVCNMVREFIRPFNLWFKRDNGNYLNDNGSI